jgi:hypothetical protein
MVFIMEIISETEFLIGMTVTKAAYNIGVSDISNWDGFIAKCSTNSSIIWNFVVDHNNTIDYPFGIGVYDNFGY